MHWTRHNSLFLLQLQSTNYYSRISFSENKAQYSGSYFQDTNHPSVPDRYLQWASPELWLIRLGLLDSRVALAAIHTQPVRFLKVLLI